MFDKIDVAQGFEPWQTESKSVVLPLHHATILVLSIGFEPMAYSLEGCRSIQLS